MCINGGWEDLIKHNKRKFKNVNVREKVAKNVDQTVYMSKHLI